MVSEHPVNEPPDFASPWSVSKDWRVVLAAVRQEPALGHAFKASGLNYMGYFQWIMGYFWGYSGLLFWLHGMNFAQFAAGRLLT